MSSDVTTTPPTIAAVALALAFAAGAQAQEEGDEASSEEVPRVRLESTFKGDKEQPAVSYFIPWQGTQAPDNLRWNIEKKHDGTLQPVDRDIMVRSINIYDEMNLEKD